MHTNTPLDLLNQAADEALRKDRVPELGDAVTKLVTALQDLDEAIEEFEHADRSEIAGARETLTAAASDARAHLREFGVTIAPVHVGG